VIDAVVAAVGVADATAASAAALRVAADDAADRGDDLSGVDFAVWNLLVKSAAVRGDIATAAAFITVMRRWRDRGDAGAGVGASSLSAVYFSFLQALTHTMHGGTHASTAADVLRTMTDAGVAVAAAHLNAVLRCCDDALVSAAADGVAAAPAVVAAHAAVTEMLHKHTH
jgi:hypothetical protein